MAMIAADEGSGAVEASKNIVADDVVNSHRY